MSITLDTTAGKIKLELHCDIVPIACRNFLGLAAAGKYNGTPFTRIMKGFIVQGGDTTLTGKSGESIYGGPFDDEFNDTLTHHSRGIIAYAHQKNLPNTNLSQFYITFAPQPHLDNVCTVFGKVIDGFDVLLQIENWNVDDRSRPTDEIIINSVHIHANPFVDIDIY